MAATGVPVSEPVSHVSSAEQMPGGLDRQRVPARPGLLCHAECLSTRMGV